MKKKLLPLLLLFIGQVSIAQEFMFQLNFTDAVGNKDSLLIGYDISATDTVDAGFGEINIISTPLDTAFDVRISSVYNTVSGWSPTLNNFQLKKQIVKNNGICDFNTLVIDVFAKHWPITAIWNDVLFNDTCREGSVLTSVHPGGWWDIGSTSNLYRSELALYSSITFSSNNDGNLSSPFSTYNSGAYLNANNDTISVFWLKLGDSSILNTAVNQLVLDNKISVYPNPTNEILNISIAKELDLTHAKIFLVDISGRVILTQPINSTESTININHLPNGVYVLKINLNNEHSILKKISVCR